MKTLRVLLTGGGTGGHIFPLIAVAEELKTQSEKSNLKLDIRYFGPLALEYYQEITNHGIKYNSVISSKLRRYWSFLNLLDGFKFLGSLFQVLWKIYWFMPEVIFSKGGPGSLAVVLAGKFYFIPVVIHESDSIPGLTSRLSSFFAKKIFLGFEGASQYFSAGGGFPPPPGYGRAGSSGGKSRIEVVGNPIRYSFSEQIEAVRAAGVKGQIECKKSFSFNAQEPVVLFIGGSQGAERINNFVLENLIDLIKNFQVLHQVGSNNYDNYKKEYEFASKGWNNLMKSRYKFAGFLSSEQMVVALTAADIIVSRSGAGAIFEMAAFGKPAVLVPLLESANGHQQQNAVLYENAGAAVVVEQQNFFGSLVIKELRDLLLDKQRLQKMSLAASNFYKPKAAATIAQYLLNLKS